MNFHDKQLFRDLRWRGLIWCLTHQFLCFQGRAADMRYVEESARTIATTATSSKIVVEKSTVPVKAAESISKVLEANQRDGVSFEVRIASCHHNVRGAVKKSLLVLFFIEPWKLCIICKILMKLLGFCIPRNCEMRLMFPFCAEWWCSMPKIQQQLQLFRRTSIPQNFRFQFSNF